MLNFLLMGLSLGYSHIVSIYFWFKVAEGGMWLPIPGYFLSLVLWGMVALVVLLYLGSGLGAWWGSPSV